jgi:DNA-binding MarR family transcriptional regulator
MAKGLGRALLTVLTQEGPGEDLEIEGPSLANARRRSLFRYLCLRPCARVGELGHALSLSQATVRWHERDLVEKGYLEFGGGHVFPRGLIDPDDFALFVVLTAPGRSAVLLACYSDPGISLRDLADDVKLSRQGASKVSSELADLGLLSLVEDGRFRRHYPTDELKRKREANVPRVKAFADTFVRRLADEGLSPEILRHDPETILVRFGTASKRVLLDLPLDPYASVWQVGR